MLLVLVVLPLGPALADGTSLGSGDWTAPSEVSLRPLGTVGGAALAEASYGFNYDCQPVSFRYDWELTDGHYGCFVSTVLGNLDVLNDALQAYGFSGAVPLQAAAGQEAFLPALGGLLALTPAAGSGSYLDFYSGSALDLQTRYSSPLHPYVQLGPGNPYRLPGPDGQPLAVWPGTLAYSSNGQWLVAEVPWHAWMRINLQTYQITPFAPSFNISPVDFKQHPASVAVSNDGRWAAIQGLEAGTFKMYDLDSCRGSGTNLQPLSCASHDYQSAVATAIPDLKYIKHVRFADDGLLTFYAGLTGSSDLYRYELSPDGAAGNYLDYLALGDSYTSGEGAGDYQLGTDTAADACHLSFNSYPLRLSRDVFTADGGHSVACSGALIDDLASRSGSYQGQALDGVPRAQRPDSQVDSLLGGFTPGELAQHEFVGRYQPRVLTVGVGGNDIGFGGILQACVEPHLGGNTCYDTYEQRLQLINLIDATYFKWTGLYRQLQAEAPSTTIYAIGYPQIATSGGNCALNVHLNEAEIAFSQQLITDLDAVIAQAAGDSGVRYVDISRALYGHRLCETASSVVAVNGLTAGRQTGITKTVGGHSVSVKFLSLGSYHPNALGQELIEQAILKATGHFAAVPLVAAGAATLPQPAADDPLLDAPKVGTVVAALMPDEAIAPGTVVRGASFGVKVDGAADGLVAGGSYSASLRGGIVLGRLTSDSGNLAGSLTIPSGAAPGNYILDITGDGLAGQPIDITKTIYVAGGNDDDDGDGVPNDSDSCPTVANSGVDADHDGNDDACQGSIGDMPGGGTDNSGNGYITGPGGSGNNPSASSTGQARASDILKAGRTVVAVLSGGAKLQTTVSPQPARNVLGANILPVAPSRTAPTGPAGHFPPLKTVHWLPWAIGGGCLTAFCLVLSNIGSWGLAPKPPGRRL